MKTAAFYDLENMGLASKNGEFEKTFSALLKKIPGNELVGEIVIQKAYISKSHPSLQHIQTALNKHNVELVAVEPVSNIGQKKSNMVDFKMNVDVIATISPRRSIKTIAVASGDKDFGFMCQQIKDMDRKLLIVSRFETTGDAMLKLCDDWVDTGDQPLTPKFIHKIIETRIRFNSAGLDFYDALRVSYPPWKMII